MGAQVRLDDSAAVQLAAQLEAIGAAILDLDSTNRAAAQLMVDGMKPPRRTGQLAAAVQAQVGPNGFTIGYPIRYATYVHWGAPRRNMRAQPWMVAERADANTDLEQLYTAHTEQAITEGARK